MLVALKNELNITWEEEDEKLFNIIEKGMGYLQEDIAGTTLEFTPTNSNGRLLLEYCRYDYNNNAEWFEENYKSDLVRLQYRSVIKKNEKVKGR